MMSKGKKFFQYAFLTIVSLLSVFPLYYMFCGATNKSTDVVAGRLYPGGYLVENFKSLIANQDLARALFNSFRNFFRMFIPTMKSTYAAAMTITFMNAWNNYLWPKVILKTNESITMPMLVANLLGGYSVDYGMLMLGVFICSVPTAIVFFCLQKSFRKVSQVLSNSIEVNERSLWMGIGAIRRGFSINSRRIAFQVWV